MEKFLLALLLVGLPVACAQPNGEIAETTHDEAPGESGEEEGEMVAKDFMFHLQRNGAHLMLYYDADAEVFAGTVANETSDTLCRVRVEVHTDTGMEIGPTPDLEVAAGETANVTLEAAGIEFEQFTAHPEVSPCSGESGEHSESGGEHSEGGEHDVESGEHGGG